MTDGYYRQPTIHRDRIVFVCEDDLWTVAAAGGVARRLTTAPGICAFPVFAPDGRRIAFTGRDDGPTEVYVTDAQGGPASRLTWLGGMLRTVAWRPGGDRILFQSNAGRPFPSDHWLHEVRAAGGPTARLPWGPLREIGFAPRGAGIVVAINSGDPARWKRYRGGTAGTIWVDREGDGEFEPLIELDGNLAAPMWIGSRIWFLSDHEGCGNLYSCTPRGRGLRRHTGHEDFYARYPSTDGKRIVYHAGADLWVHDVKSDRSALCPVELSSARSGRVRRYVNAARHLEGAELHPESHSLAVTTRGAAFTFALWEGAPARHGPVSESRMRLASWLPDGKRLVAVSDASGEERIVITSTATGRTQSIRKGFGHIVDLAVAPAGPDRIAVTNEACELWLIDLKDNKSKRVAASAWHRIQGMAWSADGRWLAYGFPCSRTASRIELYDTRRRKTFPATGDDFFDFSPAFDPAGKYLYFLSRRVYDPVYDTQYFDLGFPRGTRPCLIPLAKDAVSPFALATRPPRAVQTNAAGTAKTKTPPPCRIDLPGIADRVVAFPVPEAKYARLRATAGRVFLASLPVGGSLGQSWAATGEPEAKAKLEAWDFESDQLETIVQGITSFSMSADGKALLLRIGNRLRVLPAKVKAKAIVAKTGCTRATGWIDLLRLRLAVEPGLEWRQMFEEAWRLQRDQFWTSDMSDVDWEGVRDRYLPLADRVTTRSEFSDLLWEMQGELGTSHAYELGGDYAPSPRWYQGMLGADIAWDGKGRSWRVERIPRGDSWDPKACSPLAAPGLGVREGDEIVAVDGRKVGAKLSPHECLVNQAARPVVLDLRSRGRRRRVTVQTLGSEHALRYRDWVETNRAFVHKKTRGRVGYVHIPDMGPRGYSEFHRYFKNEVDHAGLIIDVRWNGGGHVSQLLLEKLLRKRIGYDLPRYGGLSSYPEDAPMGPMVALTNEYAGSDGDMFSHAFKLFGLGPLIGKRTWGGVVGIWPRHSLVDGTITTQPEFASWFEDVGFGIENHGTNPDIEVWIRPQDHARGRDTQLERGLAEVKRRLPTSKPRMPRRR